MYTGKYSAQFFGGPHLPSFALSASEIKTRLTPIFIFTQMCPGKFKIRSNHQLE